MSGDINNPSTLICSSILSLFECKLASLCALTIGGCAFFNSVGISTGISQIHSILPLLCSPLVISSPSSHCEKPGFGSESYLLLSSSLILYILVDNIIR
jgi:hypothetical protein